MASVKSSVAHERPELFVPSVTHEIRQNAVESASTLNDVVDTNIESTASFKYDPPGVGLRSTQQINLDWSDFSNHTFFNSAEVNVNVAFERIINEYPFDGTNKEVEKFFDGLTGFEKYVYDQFPKSKGYLHFSGALGSFIETYDYSGNVLPTLSTDTSGKSRLDPEDKSITFEMQLLVPEEENGIQVICQKLSGTKAGMTLALKSSSNATYSDLLFTAASGSMVLNASASLKRGEFNHIAAIFDRRPAISRLKLYVNQVLADQSRTAADFGNIDFKVSPLLIGSGTLFATSSIANILPTQTLSGALDEFRIFHAVRTENQLKQYAQKSLFQSPDLILYYRFNEPSGTLGITTTDTINRIVLDSSGNSLHSYINSAGFSFTLRETGSFSGPMIHEKLAYAPVLFPNFEGVSSLNTKLLTTASLYDAVNPNMITKLIPKHYFHEGQTFEGLDAEDGTIGDAYTGTGAPGSGDLGSAQLMATLLYVYAKFFDELKIFTDAFVTTLRVGYDSKETVPDQFLMQLAEYMGFKLPGFFSNASLSQFINAEDLTHDVSTAATPLRYVQNQMLRRILASLRDIITSKGTLHSIKALFRALGIDPDNSIRIREFGGPTKSSLTNLREKKTEVSTMLNMSASAASIISAYLSGAKIEPEFSFPKSRGAHSASTIAIPSFGGGETSKETFMSFDPSDGLFTSGSWTYEAMYKFPVSRRLNNASQSLARFCVTGTVPAKDPAEFRINEVSGNILWLRSDLGVTLTGSNVTAWADQSGAGHNATQTGSSDQPSYGAATGVNGKPGVVFELAGSEFMDLGVWAETSENNTVYAVCNLTGFNTSNMALISSWGGIQGIYVNLPTGGKNYVGGWFTAGGILRTAVGKLGNQVLTWISTDTDVTVKRDGAIIGSSASGASNEILGQTWLGKHQTLLADVGNYVLSEIIVFNRVLSDAETADIDAYLAARYEIAFSPTSVADNIIYLHPDIGLTLVDTTAEIVVDGDFEASGTAAWTAGNDAILSKELGTMNGIGTQVLRITYDGTPNPEAYQASLLTIGKEYRLTGQARGDGAGTSFPLILGGATIFTGNNSTATQPIDVTWTQTSNTWLRLRNQAVSGYVEFDNISVTCTTDNDVSVWTDQSGEDNHFSQSLATQRPSYIATGSNNAVHFNAAASTLLSGSVSSNTLFGSTGFSIFVLGSCTDADQGFFGGGDESPKFFLQSTASSYNDLNNLTHSLSDSLAVRHWLHDGTNFTYRENGIEIATTTVITSALGSGSQILVNGDCDSITGWGTTNSTISTASAAPADGVCLNISSSADGYAYAKQTALTIGQEYRITGSARSGGTYPPLIIDSSVRWTGTTSSVWQNIDTVYTAGHAVFGCGLLAAGSVNDYVQFDNLLLVNTADGTVVRIGNVNASSYLSGNIHSIVAYDRALSANEINSVESWMSALTSSATESNEGPGLIASLVASSGSGIVTSSLRMHCRPGAENAALKSNSPYFQLELTGANIFDGDVWHVTCGRYRNDEVHSVVSSSYYLRAAKYGADLMTEFYQTSSFILESSTAVSNSLQAVSSEFNASGTFIVIGSQSIAAGTSSDGWRYLNASDHAVSESRITNFEGNIARIRFWSKGLSESETKEHARNINSLGSDNAREQFNFVTNTSGSFNRLRLDASTDQPTEDRKAASDGTLRVFDFSQNELHFNGTGFASGSQAIGVEFFNVEHLATVLDEAVTSNKIRARSFEYDHNLANHPIANHTPVYSLLRSEKPVDDVRFSIDFSLVDALNRDIVTIFSTLDEFDQMLGKPELMFSGDYPDLAEMQDVYFNRLDKKINVRSFQDFFKWIDTSVGTFVEQLLPRKTRFLGMNFVVENHMLERPKVEYQHSDIYLGKALRYDRTLILLRQIMGQIKKY